MTEETLQRRAMKLRAKQTFFRYPRPCLLCTFLLIVLSLLAQFFSMSSGGTFFYTVLDAQQLPLETGIWRADPTAMTNVLALLGLGELGDLGGLLFTIRYEQTGQVLVFPLAWRQAAMVVVIQGLVLLVTAPLTYGVLNQYRSILEGRPLPVRALFRWYADLRLTLKALAVQVVLAVWRLLSTLLCLLPGVLCAVGGTLFPQAAPFMLLCLPLVLLGTLGGYCLYLLLLPARYVLARSPETSVRGAFTQGWALLRGRRWAYVKLDLSFLPWTLASRLLYGVPDLFVIPYMAMSNFLFLDPAPETI